MIRLISLLALLLLAPLASAQTRERIPPPEFVRETIEDEEGLKQWKEYQVKCEPCQGMGSHVCLGCKGNEEIMAKCTECKGKRRATCRTCAGEKVLPDPLVEMACPFCRGSGWFNCGQCNGPGVFFATDQNGNRTEIKCGACDKKGRYACMPCKGKHTLPTVRIKKKNPGEAKQKDLLKMREDVAEALEAFTDFEPLERVGKSLKAWEAMAKPYGKKLPSTKQATKMLEVVLKGIRKVDAGYEGFEARNTHQILLMKDRTVYMLQFNLRAIDQSIARNEYNASVSDGR